MVSTPDGKPVGQRCGAGKNILSPTTPAISTFHGRSILLPAITMPANTPASGIANKYPTELTLASLTAAPCTKLKPDSSPSIAYRQTPQAHLSSNICHTHSLAAAASSRRAARSSWTTPMPRPSTKPPAKLSSLQILTTRHPRGTSCPNNESTKQVSVSKIHLLPH